MCRRLVLVKSGLYIVAYVRLISFKISRTYPCAEHSAKRKNSDTAMFNVNPDETLMAIVQRCYGGSYMRPRLITLMVLRTCLQSHS